MTGSCGDCVYWQNLPGSFTGGACRRHPPALGIGHGNDLGRWPLTSAHDWCGEFVARAEVVDDEGE